MAEATRDRALGIVGDHDDPGARQFGVERVEEPRFERLVNRRGVLVVETKQLLLLADDTHLAGRRARGRYRRQLDVRRRTAVPQLFGAIGVDLVDSWAFVRSGDEWVSNALANDASALATAIKTNWPTGAGWATSPPTLGAVLA